jgi:hypothetical protein
MFRVYHQYGNRWNGERFERAQRICQANACISNYRTQRLWSGQLRQRFHDGAGRCIDNIAAAGGYAYGTDARAAEAGRTRANARACPDEADRTRANARACPDEADRTRTRTEAHAAAGLNTSHSVK